MSMEFRFDPRGEEKEAPENGIWQNYEHLLDKMKHIHKRDGREEFITFIDNSFIDNLFAFKRQASDIDKYNLRDRIDICDEDQTFYAYLATHLDLSWIKFCISLNPEAECNLDYALRCSMTDYNYKERLPETLVFIDELIQMGGKREEIYHYSLTWDYPKIFEHMCTHYGEKEPSECAMRNVFTSCCFKSMPYIWKKFPKFRTHEYLVQCVKSIVENGAYCEIEKWRILKKLMMEKGISYPNPVIDSLVRDRLFKYTEEEFAALEFDLRHFPYIRSPNHIKFKESKAIKVPKAIKVQTKK